MVCLNDEADASVDGCGHRFCKECITSWCYYHYQANCPTCRTEIREIRDLSTAAAIALPQGWFRGGSKTWPMARPP